MPAYRHGNKPTGPSAPSPASSHLEHDNNDELASTGVDQAGEPYQSFWENLRDEYVPNTLDDRVAAIVEAGQGINPHFTLSNAQRQAVNHIRRLPSPPLAFPEPYFDVNEELPRLQPPTSRTSPISPSIQHDQQQQMVHKATETIAQGTQHLYGNHLGSTPTQLMCPSNKRELNSTKSSDTEQKIHAPVEMNGDNNSSSEEDEHNSTPEDDENESSSKEDGHKSSPEDDKRTNKDQHGDNS